MENNDLTKRERQFAGALLSGWSYDDIARFYGLSVQTVKNTISRLYHKSNCRNKTDLALKFQNGGIVVTPPEDRIE